ncbi:MAG: CopG family transcriptional regulator [Cyclobacteriaceae bacterium]
MLNVRLDKDTEKKLKTYTENQNVSKTNVVKEALHQYFTTEEARQRPYVLGEDLFGIDASGISDRSKTYKSKLKAKLNAKHSH